MDRKQINDGLDILYKGRRLEYLFEHFLQKENLIEHMIKKIKKDVKKTSNSK